MSGAKALSTGDAEPLGNNIIHSVTNPIRRLTGAIHVYGGDFFHEERSEWDRGQAHMILSIVTGKEPPSLDLLGYQRNVPAPDIPALLPLPPRHSGWVRIPPCPNLLAGARAHVTPIVFH
jgi:hypothetical protein